MFGRNGGTEATKKKLIAKLEDKKRVMDQDVHVRDIIIYPKDSDASYGESRRTANRYLRTLFFRLVAHIDALARIANTYHEKYYCEQTSDGQYVTKPDALNKITRLSLNEFSLYGDRPLSMEEFALLHKEVQAIAEKQQENVHLLLSSIPVRTKDNQILNTCLYVQCGPEPKIETFSKATASSIDVQYHNMTNFAQQRVGHVPTHASHFIAPGDDQAAIVSNNSVFQVKTKGGAEYTQAIDVCLDHATEHSKRLVQAAASTANTALIPRKIDHMVTANSVPIKDAARVSESITHIDPRFNRAKAMKSDSVSASDLNNSKNERLANMSITAPEDPTKGDGFLVRNPPFGSDYTVVACEERKLGGFSPTLNRAVADHNKVAVIQQIHTAMDLPIPYSLMSKIKEFNKMTYRTEKFLHTLSKKCEPSFLEGILKASGYQLKCEAKKAIQETREKLSALNEKAKELAVKGNLSPEELEESLRQHTDVLMKDLKFKLENLDHGILHDFTQQLGLKISIERADMAASVVSEKSASSQQTP